MQKTEKVAVVGLGYVGLPLALALARYYETVGIDTDAQRVAELENGYDRTGEAGKEQMALTRQLRYTTDIRAAADCTIYIVTAPTPVDKNLRPDLSLLEKATQDVGEVLSKGDFVIFESTVCPGTTEEFCAPILAHVSSLRWGDDFSCGYSPERIAPNEKGLSDAVKIVSASDADAVARIIALYEKIIPAGLHVAPSIRVAEAAKLSENIQRDVDIAITNELAMIYNRMGINSDAVFEAAATKWNYRRFAPGLVGGHCIGTDSYYLLDKATDMGWTTELLSAARQVNNAVPGFVAEQALDLLRQHNITATDAKVLILGFSFKENCPDVRRTLVEPLRQSLLAAGCEVSVCDPVADVRQAEEEYGVAIIPDIAVALASHPALVIFAVAHREFKAIPVAALAGMLVADVKRIAPRADWRL